MSEEMPEIHLERPDLAEQLWQRFIPMLDIENAGDADRILPEIEPIYKAGIYDLCRVIRGQMKKGNPWQMTLIFRLLEGELKEFFDDRKDTDPNQQEVAE